MNLLEQDRKYSGERYCTIARRKGLTKKFIPNSLRSEGKKMLGKVETNMFEKKKI